MANTILYVHDPKTGNLIPIKAVDNGDGTYSFQAYGAGDAQQATLLLVKAKTDLIVSGGALEATLTAMKGAGWTTQTLVALMTAIGAIPTTAMRGTDNAFLAANGAKMLFKLSLPVSAYIPQINISSVGDNMWGLGSITIAGLPAGATPAHLFMHVSRCHPSAPIHAR